VLDILQTPLTSLRGLGPRLTPLLARLVGGDKLRDLLFHLPTGVIARPLLKIAEISGGQIATVAVEVIRHETPLRKPQPWKVVVGDGSRFAEITLFHPARLRQLPVGAKLLVSGKFEEYQGRISLPHPDHVVPADRGDLLPKLEPVWPLANGIVPRVIAGAMRQALALLPEQCPEWLDPGLVKRESWPGFCQALRQVQAPDGSSDQPARARLAYDELLAHQIALVWRRNLDRHRKGRRLSGDGALREAALRRFGHKLTPSQNLALAEIDADLAAPHQMRRLLQGDVGSGKTLVALMAILRAVEAGFQAVLMAPTEILAQQHFKLFQRLAGVPAGLLTGSVKGRTRRTLLEAIGDGTLPIVIGTHALFQEGVRFHDLALVVIDEQHRFGVEQRQALGAKGESVDLLAMTATPIPRSLLLTRWGELEVSRITEKPVGRKRIITTIHPLSRVPDLGEGLGRQIAEGARVYWVCPLVAESAELDLAAAEQRFASLRERFGDRVGIAHGQMDAALRDAALADFAAGRTAILVATTVIEVGVDVPEATIMVVEHAERFGLAQLHQLRGRVGRGREQSFCLLLHADVIGPTARGRLVFLRDCDDGFLIADEDFRLRGAGELLGTRQSGELVYRLASPELADRLLPIARKDAEYILNRHPGLAGERGEAVRLLLGIFDRGAALRTLRAG